MATLSAPGGRARTPQQQDIADAEDESFKQGVPMGLAVIGVLGGVALGYGLRAIQQRKPKR
jgi:hypothetical protein